MAQSLFRRALLLALGMQYASAMEAPPEQLSLNMLVNGMTARMMGDTIARAPDTNMVFSAWGPLTQLLVTSSSLRNTDDPDSVESKIKEEICQGLGVQPGSEDAYLQQILDLTHRSVAKQAHLLAVSTHSFNPDFKAGDGWPLTVFSGDLSDPSSVSILANTLAAELTDGRVRTLAQNSDFAPTTSNVAISAVHLVSKWESHFQEKAIKFHGKDQSYLVKALFNKQYAFVYDSEEGCDNPFKIVYLKGEGQSFFAIKQHDNGSVSPISLEDFGHTASGSGAFVVIPKLSFSSDLDLTYLKETMPTLFSTEYQTTYNREPAMLSVLKQKSCVDVDKNGFKASSVTLKVEYTLGCGPDTTREIIIDRPFSFVVMERTGSDKARAENYIQHFGGFVTHLPAVNSEKDKMNYMKLVDWRADDLRMQIGQAKRDGASQEVLEKMQANLKALEEEHQEAYKDWSLSWGK